VWLGSMVEMRARTNWRNEHERGGGEGEGGRYREDSDTDLSSDNKGSEILLMENVSTIFLCNGDDASRCDLWGDGRLWEGGLCISESCSSRRSEWRRDLIELEAHRTRRRIWLRFMRNQIHVGSCEESDLKTLQYSHTEEEQEEESDGDEGRDS
jgi:hypothetical protein